LEAIRKDLERQDRERRQSEEQKRFQQQGSKIADFINEHFKNWRAKLRNTMAKAGTGKDLLSAKEQKQSAEEGVVHAGAPAACCGLSTGVDPKRSPCRQQISQMLALSERHPKNFHLRRRACVFPELLARLQSRADRECNRLQESDGGNCFRHRLLI